MTTTTGLRTFGPHEVGWKLHVRAPVPKHVENSLHGTRYAARHGYDTTDLDMLPDAVLTERAKDPAPMTFAEIVGHLRNTHWEDPFRHDGFRDPKHILGKGDLVTEMHPYELDRLVAGHWPGRRFHIPRIEDQLALCGELERQALLEPKRSRVWLRQEVWNYLAAMADWHGTRTAVYSLMHECLPYARQAGFRAWPIAA